MRILSILVRNEESKHAWNDIRSLEGEIQRASERVFVESSAPLDLGSGLGASGDRRAAQCLL